MRTLRHLPIVLALVFLAACSAESTTNPCDGPRTVSVSADPVPVISWAPVCDAAWVTVQDVTADTQPYVWTIVDTNVGFQSPLTYGVLPSGHGASTVIVEPQPLVVGHEYKVMIYRQRDVGETFPIEAGSTTFTR